MLDQRLGDRELMRLYNLCEQLFPRLVALTARARRFEILAHLLAQLFQGLRVAHILGEFIGQLGPFLFLDAQDFDRVGVCFSLELWIRIVGGIGHVKILVIAGVCAAQIFIERRPWFLRRPRGTGRCRLRAIRRRPPGCLSA